MPLVEALALKLVGAAAGAAVKLLLKEQPVGQDVSAAFIDFMVGEASSRAGTSPLVGVERAVARELSGFLAHERGLPANEREAAVDAVTRTIGLADIDLALLKRLDFDAELLERHLRTASARVKREALLNPAASRLYDLALRASCKHVVELSTQLAPFVSDALIEVLRRQTETRRDLGALRELLEAKFGQIERALGKGGFVQPPPAQLPAQREAFVGRTQLVAETAEWLAAGAPVVISGMAGVGKTTLAVQVGHRVREAFPDGQLFRNLHGLTSASSDAGTVLAEFLRALGVARDQIPESVDEREALYRSLLATRRILVVLDDAGGSVQIRPLLPGNPASSVLITSRERLTGLDGGARMVELGVLEPDEAMRLLVTLAGEERVAREPDAAREIVRLCGYLPLAVSIAGALLARRPRWELSDFLRRLEDERGRLAQLRMGAPGGENELSVESAFSLSEDALDEFQRRAFRLLGLLDVPSFPAWVAAAMLEEIDTSEAERLLDRLVDTQLLEVTDPVLGAGGGPRYHFHDLIRLFARQRAGQNGQDERTEALARTGAGYLTLAEHAAEALPEPGLYRDLGDGDAPRWRAEPQVVAAVRADPIGWFEIERSSLIAMIEQSYRAQLWELTWELVDELPYFFDIQPFWEGWRALLDLALDATRQAGNRRGEAQLLFRLGVFLRHDRSGESIAFLEQSLEIFRELGDRRGEAYALCDIGINYRGLGRNEAAEYVGRSLSLFQEAGDRRAAAYALLELADIFEDQGEHDEAERRLESALQDFLELDDERGEATALRSLAVVRRERGEFNEAVRDFQRSIVLFERLRNQRFELLTRRSLGTALLRQGYPEEAAAEFERALEGARDRGDVRGEAQSRIGLGEAWLRQDRRDAGIEQLERALSLYQAVGDDEQGERIRARLREIREVQ